MGNAGFTSSTVGLRSSGLGIKVQARAGVQDTGFMVRGVGYGVGRYSDPQSYLDTYLLLRLEAGTKALE